MQIKICDRCSSDNIEQTGNYHYICRDCDHENKIRDKQIGTKYKERITKIEEFFETYSEE